MLAVKYRNSPFISIDLDVIGADSNETNVSLNHEEQHDVASAHDDTDDFCLDEIYELPADNTSNVWNGVNDENYGAGEPYSTEQQPCAGLASACRDKLKHINDLTYLCSNATDLKKLIDELETVRLRFQTLLPHNEGILEIPCGKKNKQVRRKASENRKKQKTTQDNANFNAIMKKKTRQKLRKGKKLLPGTVQAVHVNNVADAIKSKIEENDSDATIVTDCAKESKTTEVKEISAVCEEKEEDGNKPHC
jgi:hypothetical protein